MDGLGKSGSKRGLLKLNGDVGGYPTYRKPFDVIFERAKTKEWSALEDDFRTFLLMPGGSESIFQEFTA